MKKMVNIDSKALKTLKHLKNNNIFMVSRVLKNSVINSNNQYKFKNLN